MKAYYEKKRQENPIILVQKNKHNSFPLHFHNNIEVYILKQGERTVYLNGKTFTMKSGSVAFFDSYDIHGYDCANDFNEDYVVIIPFSYLNKFNNKRNSLRASASIIFNPELCSKLIDITENGLE